MIVEEFKLEGEQYEIIKKDFRKIRKEHGLIRKDKFPVFKWIGRGEFLEARYVREFNPRTGEERLKSATLTWKGEDITHFLVDLKELVNRVS